MEPFLRTLTTLGRSTDAAAQSAVEPVSSNKNVWRLALRSSGALELKVEWKTGDTEGAYARMCDRIRGATADQQPLQDADPIDVFMGSVISLELARIPASYEKLDLQGLPFVPATLTSLQVLMLSSDDLLTEGTLNLFLHSTMVELSLAGQKLTYNKVDQLFFPLPASLHLTSLRIKRNLLTHLPEAVMQKCICLTELDASDNKLADVPSNLLQLCPKLEVLNLEGNRLQVPALDFRNCSLRTLQFGLNPLEYLPTLAPLSRLIELSVCSLRITKKGPRRDPRLCFETMPVTAEILKPGGGPPLRVAPWTAEAEKNLRPALSLLFKSSASFHPLLASLLSLLGEDERYRDLLGTDPACLHHVLSMCQAPEPVALDACVALSRLAETEALAKALIDNLAVERLVDCLHTGSDALCLYVMQTLRCFAAVSVGICEQIICPTASAGSGISRYQLVMTALLRLLNLDGHRGLASDLGVCYRTLVLVGELAFSPGNRQMLLADQQVMTLIRTLCIRHAAKEPPQEEPRSVCAEGDVVLPMSPKLRKGVSFGGRACPRGEVGSLHREPKTHDVARAARRVLAILGDNATLTNLLGPPSFARAGPGIRVLSIDGGGVKGIAGIKMMADLERRLGKPLHQVFDLIVGTSAGAITAAALGMGKDCSACETLYKLIVRKAFSVLQTEGGEDGSAAGSSSVQDGNQGVTGPGGATSAQINEVAEKAAGGGWWQRLVASGSSMKRVILTGAKYDASPLLQALSEGFGESVVESRMVESSLQPGACHVAIVAALCSTRPLRPFVFRTYELPPGSTSVFPGSCRHQWLEAMRASSAAPYFFEEFVCRGERFQDGAIIANNPAVIALHEAQHLWPGRPLDVLVSVGTGKVPYERRDTKRTGGWGLIDTFGEYMVESAVSTDRVAEALEAFAPLVPNTSIYRLQVEDERCNLELDNTSAEALGGLGSAAQEYVESNSALFSSVAGALAEHGWPATTTQGELGNGGKHVGVLVMDIGEGTKLADVLSSIKVEYNFLGLGWTGIEARSFAATLKGSPFGIVHVQSNAAMAGEGFVLGWDASSVNLSVHETQCLLNTSNRAFGEKMDEEPCGMTGNREVSSEERMGCIDVDVEMSQDNESDLAEAGQGSIKCYGGSETEEGDVAQLLSTIIKKRVILASEAEHFVYSSCGGSMVCGKHVMNFVFQKMKVRDLAQWTEMASIGCFRGKCIVSSSVLSAGAAKAVLVAGGASAVVWAIWESEFVNSDQVWSLLYQFLTRGDCPTSAVTAVNHNIRREVLACIC